MGWLFVINLSARFVQFLISCLLKSSYRLTDNDILKHNSEQESHEYKNLNSTFDTNMPYMNFKLMNNLYKRGGITTNLNQRNHRNMLLICQNTTMRMYGAWIKTYYVWCSKTYSTSGKVFKSTAGSRQAARSARISETRLLLISIQVCLLWITPQKGWLNLQDILSIWCLRMCQNEETNRRQMKHRCAITFLQDWMTFFQD